jgi:hypothetical protein
LFDGNTAWQGHVNAQLGQGEMTLLALDPGAKTACRFAAVRLTGL